MQIFLISGKAGNGKDTVGNLVGEYLSCHNKKFVKTQYGKYVKMYTKELTNWDGSEATKSDYRDFFQSIGTQVIREKMKKADLFVSRMIEDIEVYHYYVDAVVISDVRFPIEIEAIKKHFNDVYTIRVISPNYISKLTKEQLAHETENALSDDGEYDYILINTSIDKLKKDIDEILEGIDANEKINK